MYRKGGNQKTYAKPICYIFDIYILIDEPKHEKITKSEKNVIFQVLGERCWCKYLKIFFSKWCDKLTLDQIVFCYSLVSYFS